MLEENAKNRAKFLNQFPQSLNVLADFYYRCGHLQLTTVSEVKQGRLLASWLAQGSPLTPAEEAFFQIFTASSLAHKRARFSQAIYLENGLFPNRATIQSATALGEKYYFLRFLVDAEKSVLFKYLE